MDATCTFTVGPDDTAIALGSGTLPVLGTPRVVAWLEAATCSALAGSLSPGQTSVGTRIEVEHVAACGIGSTVQTSAEQVYDDGRLRRFSVIARSGTTVLATGQITRVVVDADRFMSRVG